MAARSIAPAFRRQGAGAAVLAGLAVCVLLGIPGVSSADAEPPETLTFTGPAGGGTIRVTTTADRTGVIRAELIDVSFAPCGGANGLRYQDPAAPIIDEEFSVSIGGPLVINFFSDRLTASFVSETTIVGTATRSVFFPPSIGCGPISINFTLTGPVDTPPSPDDLVFVGSAKSSPGDLIVTTDPDRTVVTSITVTGLVVPPCLDESTSMNVIAFLDPLEPIDRIDGTFEALLRVDSPLVFDSRTLIVRGTFDASASIAGTIEFSRNPLICAAQVSWNTLRKGVPIPRMRKLPPLQNLFLTRQGTKIPPVRCLDSTNVATLAETISVPLTGVDPKDPSQPQRLGGFSFQVKYDPLKVCVTLRPGAAWTASPAQVCTIEDSASAPALQGVARINCVTLGKATVVDTGDPAGRVLALIDVRPQPEAYSQLRANQDNGQVVQLNNEACKLTDLQGHAIEVFSCEDADVTVRFLEGDVEPDCQVNTLDTQAIAFRWGATKGSQVYNDRFNLEPSGTQADQDVDINDLQFVYGRFGSTCALPWPAQPPVKAK